MIRISKIFRVLFFPTGACVIALLATAAPARPDETRTIEISAKRFEFTPTSITLKRGESVKLRLVSQDVRHGFFQKELGIDSEFVPGEKNEIQVAPDRAGTFTAICDRFCGTGHGGMKMTFVVTEEGQAP